MNSLWLIITALAAFAVAYRFYGAFLATKVAMLNDKRQTPAHRLKDGVDYYPTNKLVLFGHHFAAIAGPGPLIGPVLAAQWGFFPGFSWIIVGACLAGGVHDFVTLWASVRQDGHSLANIARRNIGPVAGITTSIATMFIMVAVLASVAIVVVKALSDSPWGMFTIIVTIPAALLTGLWMYKIRPGKVGEASVIGVSIVLLGVYFGRPFAEMNVGDYHLIGGLLSHFFDPSHPLGHYLKFKATTLSIMLPVYAFFAASLPVWVLMCPRDYLSSYMKIGVMIVLAVGLIIAHPVLKMPATTPFIHGGGPVVSGTVWPFVCIVIMCGALSGFHSLIASGTTPKMINKESDIRPIGYGAMVLEGFVAVTALVAACALEPGDYFLINADQKNPAMHVAYTEMARRSPTELGFDPAPKQIDVLEQETNETLRNRPGGAVTLAVGMAKVFSNLPGMKTLVAYWYHFVIMFEALFILTLLETGTRVARFVFQETLIQIRGSPPPEVEGGAPALHRANWLLNIALSGGTCFLWGYLLYTGNLNTLWRILGIANQLLAVIALAVGTTYLLNHAPKRSYAWLTAIPFAFALTTVMTAGVQSLRGWWGNTDDPQPLMCFMATTMLILTAVITLDAVRKWWQIIGSPSVGLQAAPDAQV